MKDQIAIWGAGVRGREAYYELKKKFHIVGFLDSDIRKKDMEIVDGKRVLGQEVCVKDTLIVISCGKWLEVLQTLKGRGLNVLVDYIPYHMLLGKKICLHEMLDCFGTENTLLYLQEVKKHKKIALLYGNCQTEIIANMLEYNHDFESQYTLLRVPQVHLYRDEEQVEQIFYQNGIMGLVDLFIYQNVKENNRFYTRLGTDTILEQVSEACRKIPIHNIYFDGYFIQFEADENRYFENFLKKDFPYTDIFVNRFLEEGKNADEIIKLLEDDELVPEYRIIERCEESIENLRQRERSVEVAIVDFIEDNYREEQLFYTCNHPKNIVIYEYVKRILKTIGIEKTDKFTEEEMNMEFGTLGMANSFPVFPCVIKALGLKKYDTKAHISNVSSNLITMDAYIREYIYRCYEIE